MEVVEIKKSTVDWAKILLAVLGGLIIGDFLQGNGLDMYGLVDVKWKGWGDNDDDNNNPPSSSHTSTTEAPHTTKQPKGPSAYDRKHANDDDNGGGGWSGYPINGDPASYENVKKSVGYTKGHRGQDLENWTADPTTNKELTISPDKMKVTFTGNNGVKHTEFLNHPVTP